MDEFDYIWCWEYNFGVYPKLVPNGGPKNLWGVRDITVIY
jgi:hypothetical protein